MSRVLRIGGLHDITNQFVAPVTRRSGANSGNPESILFATYKSFNQDFALGRDTGTQPLPFSEGSSRYSNSYTLAWGTGSQLSSTVPVLIPGTRISFSGLGSGPTGSRFLLMSNPLVEMSSSLPLAVRCT